jgi:hypothetical protein
MVSGILTLEASLSNYILAFHLFKTLQVAHSSVHSLFLPGPQRPEIESGQFFVVHDPKKKRLNNDADLGGTTKT